MEGALLVANWKANKTKDEAKTWLLELSKRKEILDGRTIVVCPPDSLLDFVKNFVSRSLLNLSVGAQNISEFDEGPYTGEITAKLLKEFADYVIVGHSERRTKFSETNETVRRKAERAQAAGIKPIVCISDLTQLDSISDKNNLIIAYEPLWAIGTGKSEDPEAAEEMAKKIKEKLKAKVIYGGSVNAHNVNSFTSLENIEGVLVGGESLSAESFINLIENA